MNTKWTLYYCIVILLKKCTLNVLTLKMGVSQTHQSFLNITHLLLNLFPTSNFGMCFCIHKIFTILYPTANGVYHNGRVSAFGPGDPGSNPGEDQCIIEFK